LYPTVGSVSSNPTQPSFDDRLYWRLPPLLAWLG